MNRPGSAQLDLYPYALGPNLTYSLIEYDEAISFTYKILKISKVEECEI